ncbi:LysR family transcriptional regulator [Pigmentiphaga kullae]|uniref:DNA-binding transcriptional LysR family regulator n=1 Tax=Pigmentiphaga kullae TaxID=151784 RepID=A0A4Q7N7Z1_9BURK|nr:LysR family transcriptional regulator [Pigmentiphaga kullae]RZS78192.1 DNA-binding transcriptional LysR family regulator [Pigmentiphaga kullae]
MTQNEENGAPVPLRVLRAVAAVAEAGGVTRAASMLHQSASSVTRAIQEAEARLGIRLFDRGARGMAATAAGEILALRVARATALLRAAADGLRLRGAPASVMALPRLVGDTSLAALALRAEHATEGAAAEALGISQSALHQALRRLEHLAKLPLFERTRVGTRLNESGRWLLLHGRRAVAEIRIGHEELARWRGLGGRRVSIGSLPMTGDVLVPRAAALAIGAESDLSLAIKGGTYEALTEMLRAADIDFIVGPLRGATLAADFVEEVLFVDRFVAVVRAGHPLLAHRRRPSLRQMAAYPWVGPLPGTPAQRVFDRLFVQAGIPMPGVSIQAHSTAVVRSVLLSGNHVALVSPLQVRAEVEAGLLVHASGPLGGTERGIGITQRRDALASSACLAVMEALRRAAAEAVDTPGNK